MAEMHQSGLKPCGYNPNIRKTDRLELKSNEISDILMKRVFPYLPRSIAIQKSTNGWPEGIPRDVPDGEWFPSSMNQPLRICRYQPGGFFLPHHDEPVIKNDFERSFITLMLYLNDDFEGGTTNFYNKKQHLYSSSEINNRILSFQPHVGDVLLFFSAITHDGGKVLRGQKYILRSEIMFKRKKTCLEEKVEALCHTDHDDEPQFYFIPGEDSLKESDSDSE